MHKFVIKHNNELHTYSRFEDIPMEFDHIIEFAPSVPEPPHTQAQHDEMAKWPELLEELIQREKK